MCSISSSLKACVQHYLSQGKKRAFDVTKSDPLSTFTPPPVFDVHPYIWHCNPDHIFLSPNSSSSSSSSIHVAPTFEHRSTVKRFLSLRFLNLRQSVRLLGRGISPSQGRYLHKHRINTDIHALSGIRTHHPSFRAGEDISCLRPRGHCGRLSCN
jgi:hypothetical protein